MTTRSRVSAVVLAGALVTGVGGCSAEQRPERADTITAPSAAAPSTTAAVENAAADTILTVEQAQAALLTVQDLPTGWTTDPTAAEDDETDPDDDIEPAECAAVFEAMEEGNEPAAKADGSYTAGGFGPLLQQTVTSFEEDTSDRIQTVTDALNQCSTFTSTTADGVATTLTSSPLSFPNLGDRSLAVRLTGSSDDIEATFDVVYIAVGKNSITLLGGGLTPLPGAELEAVARKAVERLNAAAAA